jgi:hypothetical protein
LSRIIWYRHGVDRVVGAELRPPRALPMVVCPYGDKLGRLIRSCHP